jgi:hypothetical protein
MRSLTAPPINPRNGRNKYYEKGYWVMRSAIEGFNPLAEDI